MARKSLTEILGGRKTFGSYTVLKEGRRNPKKRYAQCRCACGEMRDVAVPNLLSGRSTQCRECARKSSKRVTNRIHGMSRSPEYEAWKSMRWRCENPTAHNYERYGGRGIKVCERWQSFPNFLADMGLRPSPRHSLDRIDNDGDYEPGNCRWTTPKRQSGNRRNTIQIEVDGRLVPVSRMAHAAGMSPATLAARLKAGWPLDDALRLPVEDRRPRHIVRGEALTASEIEARYGIPRQRLNRRLRNGMTPDEAVNLG